MSTLPEIPAGWQRVLPLPAVQTAMALLERAERERAEGKEIYPALPDTFAALALTAPEDCHVVILGQDPYHEPGQAHGLAFSVREGVRFPASLRNIFAEREHDLGLPVPGSGDLTAWAGQGVLLLNTCLTVERGCANAHSRWGWQSFTGAVLRAVWDRREQGVVFLLWGKQALATAQQYCPGVERHEGCLISSHPSPLSARRPFGEYPAFLGSRPFTACNACLRSCGVPEIQF